MLTNKNTHLIYIQDLWMGYKMETNRTLVERAFELAEKYEKEGNKQRADYFLSLVDKANELYDRIESGKKDILK